ncbi:MAG: ABC transporter substrate-binding protein [Candidatus Cloacimonadaceae bacterium]
MKKKPVLLVLCLLAITFLASCGNKEKPVLRIGMNAEFPPFASIVDSTFVGVDVDISHKIAEKLDLPYEIVNMEFGTLINALQADKVDIIISAMSITPDRARILEFSEPYYRATQVLIAGEKSPQMPDSEEQLKNYRIGVLHSSTAHKYINETFVDKDLMPHDALLLYSTNVEAINDLIAGNIDFMVNDSSAAYGFSQSYPVSMGLHLNTVEEYAIAMPRDGQYNEKIKKALRELIDSGEVTSIISNYFF